MGIEDTDHQTAPEAQPEPVDIKALRERLAGAEGPTYWRSLSELARTPEFEEALHRELPRFAAEWPQGLSRRGFLELSAASLALAGLTACTRQPSEAIVPYVKAPEDIVLGRPLYYATSYELSGHGFGLLAEAHEGRPTKLEGNPDHPASQGATDVFAQAEILALYDPDRSQTVTHLERITTWSAFVDALKARQTALAALNGDGLRILTPTVGSPTLGAQLAQLAAKYPKAVWHQWEAAGRHSARAAAQRAFGTAADTRYDLSQADVIVALESDFLTAGADWVRHARDFARRRRVSDDLAQAEMSRFYCAEASPSASGALADHRLAVPPAGVLAVAASLAAELGVAGASAAALAAWPQAAAWVKAAAADLAAHRGRSLVIAGEHAAPALHVLAHAINQALGNVGTTVVHSEPVEARAEDQFASIRQLADDLRAGKVDTLLILGGNPVYDAPVEVDFPSAITKANFSAHLSLYADETSRYCQWHLPACHFLESWGDTRSSDGTIAPIQPLIAPLYDGHTASQVLALFGDVADATPYELVRETWKQGPLAAAPDFEAAWRRALHDGVLPATALAAKAVSVAPAAVAEACAAADASGFTLLLRPDPSLYDGRYANNGWLQELPKPLSKITWDNALLVSPRDAAELGLRPEGKARVAVNGKSLEVPVWVLPGHAAGCATLHLGFGRQLAGRVGNGVGVDAYPLRTAASPWALPGARVEAVAGSYKLASTQEHWDLEIQSEQAGKRHLVRHATLAELKTNPEVIQQQGHPAPAADDSMFSPHPYNGYSWGLTVDLSACVGCNACVVACQSENNIPVVGKEQVGMGREMHWIRIDRYYQGSLDDPSVHHQPVMCQHCELAPCEVVCPVAATVHGPEGLNEMVYNRCVGTRYCLNNCPYKVRRFNFFLYSDFTTEVARLGRNPNVTVRSRGVMEKCTFCVQRINAARIDAKRENRQIQDGQVRTACQQACPAEAISFGNLNDPKAAINGKKASRLNYGLLADLGTRPRTTYLAKLSNPNPALGGGPAEHGTSAHEGEHAG